MKRHGLDPVENEKTRQAWANMVFSRTTVGSFRTRILQQGSVHHGENGRFAVSVNLRIIRAPAAGKQN